MFAVLVRKGRRVSLYAAYDTKDEAEAQKTLIERVFDTSAAVTVAEV